MKTSRTGSLAQDLLASAREDRPSTEQRSRIWEQVALAPHLSVVAAAPLVAEAARSTSIAPAKVALASGLSASKMLILGAIAGSALTVGLGFFVLRPTAAVQAHALVGTTVPAAESVASRTARAASPSQVIDDPQVTTEIDGPAIVPVAPARARETVARNESATHPRQVVPAGASEALGSQDLLMHEAALVSQARTAIVQGHPAAALDVLDLAAQDSSHSLEPEELSLRVRALRLLGRDAEALRVEETLKARYPGNFLSH